MNFRKWKPSIRFVVLTIRQAQDLAAALTLRQAQSLASLDKKTPRWGLDVCVSLSGSKGASRENDDVWSGVSDSRRVPDAYLSSCPCEVPVTVARVRKAKTITQGRRGGCVCSCKSPEE